MLSNYLIVWLYMINNTGMIQYIAIVTFLLGRDLSQDFLFDIAIFLGTMRYSILILF